MIESKLEKLAHACAIISGYAAEGILEAMEQLTAAFAAYEAKVTGISTDISWDDTRDPLEELRRLAEGMKEMDSLLSAMAEEPADIETPRKVPRPPKRLGPVNKANYTTNRPPRRARSSCYSRRH